MGMIDLDDAIEAIASRDETDGTVKVFTGREINKILSDLPSAQPEGISGVFIPDITVKNLRKAPLEAVGELLVVGEMEDIVLPSAQPDIIRCKDCKWWDKSEDSPFGYCMAMKHGYMSAHWEIGIYRRYKGDWYCADAERRTDE